LLVDAVAIEYDPEFGCFTVDGKIAIPIERDDAVVASLEAVSSVSVRSFEHALAAYEAQDAATVIAVYISDVPAAGFDPDLALRHVALDFLGGKLTAQVGRSLDTSANPPLNVEEVLRPLLERHIGIYDGDYRDDHEGHQIENYSLFLAGEDRTIQELFELARDSQALLDAADGVGALNARAVRDLVAGGRPGTLLGQPEVSWIDVKVVPHQLAGDGAGIELAKDVAAFANTGEDAIIVWGLSTTKAHGGDMINATRPFELTSVDIGAIRSALADRLVPLLTDIEIQLVELRAGYGFGWIFIPAQPSFVQPVLVRGAIEGSRVFGTHISVPFRVEEDTRHWDASTVHSLIQAGRVALQRAGDSKSTGDATTERPRTSDAE
jgi:hypothetical protein